MYQGTPATRRWVLPTRGHLRKPGDGKTHLSPCLLFKLMTEFPPGGLGCTLVIAEHLPSLSFPVCISYLGRFYQDLKDRDVTFSPSSVEKELIKFCREARGKENRLVSSWLPSLAGPAHLPVQEVNCSVSMLVWDSSLQCFHEFCSCEVLLPC